MHFMDLMVDIVILCTHPLAPEELQGGVDVAEVVRPPQHAASLHRQSLPAQHLQQCQQLHTWPANIFNKFQIFLISTKYFYNNNLTVAEIIDEVLHFHGWLPLAEVGVDPVHEGLALDTLLLI